MQTYYRLKQWDTARAHLKRAMELGSRERTPDELREYLSTLPKPLIAPPMMDGTASLYAQSGLSNLAGGTRGAVVALFTDSSKPRLKAKETKHRKNNKSCGLTNFDETHEGAKLVKVDINSWEGNKTANRLGVITTPTLLVFDSERMIRHYQIGKIDKVKLNSELDSLSSLASK